MPGTAKAHPRTAIIALLKSDIALLPGLARYGDTDHRMLRDVTSEPIVSYCRSSDNVPTAYAEPP